jgi:hypothetical protein
MRIIRQLTEVELEANDVLNALTEDCPNAKWGECNCGACLDGQVLNSVGKKLQTLFANG